MEKCHRPEWSDEFNDNCDCDRISNTDMEKLWQDICPECRWWFDCEEGAK